ncbi:hypothetical protein [Natrinema sp. SYSU A 869]|uniref:hypothetical protein n=1 Tax=Natrinema sp. SYSU A 869 TaxID=2871694 RepID=UPI001CA44A51|nr:hypothetical protein [Natrinema sp. SYSU A 869]
MTERSRGDEFDDEIMQHLLDSVEDEVDEATLEEVQADEIHEVVFSTLRVLEREPEAATVIDVLQDKNPTRNGP